MTALTMTIKQLHYPRYYILYNVNVFRIMEVITQEIMNHSVESCMHNIPINFVKALKIRANLN